MFLHSQSNNNTIPASVIPFLLPTHVVVPFSSSFLLLEKSISSRYKGVSLFLICARVPLMWEGNKFLLLKNLSSLSPRAVFKFDGNSLGVTATGKEFPGFKGCFSDEDRGFGYIRINVRRF